MKPNGQPPRVWAVVPAAGMSRRMGKPKQALPFGRSTMAGTVVRTLLEAGVVGVVVVTRSELIARLDLPSDPRVRTAINDDPESEMIDSIRIGLASLGTTEGLDRLAAGSPDSLLQTPVAPSRDSVLGRSTVATGGGRYVFQRAAKPAEEDGVLVVPADMPGVGVDACRACMAAYDRDPSRIVVATHAGRRGHPMIFPFALKASVARLAGGLRMLLDEYPDRILPVAVDDSGVTRDVDTPEDYEQPGPHDAR